MTESIRCGNCTHWLGESSVPLVFVAHVQKGEEPGVERPRDLRLCKSCGSVNVFVSRNDLAGRLAGV